MFDEKEIIEPAAPVRESGLIATLADGTKISMKNACNLCGYSLEWCQHEKPIVFGQEVTVSTN